MKNNEEKKIYVDKEGYQALIESVNEIKRKINMNNAGRKEAFDASAGDGWDSPEFEEIERQEYVLMVELQRRVEELKRAVIIEKHNDEEIVDIGDVLQVEVTYAVDDIEDLTFKLVGTSGKLDAEIKEISVNSPLGASVYKKHVGDQTSYSVGESHFKVLIKDKMNFTKEPNSPTKKLIK